MGARRVAIIPARWGSTRFPGKPLARLDGVPLVVHVLRRVEASGLFETFGVATDDERIAAVVRQAGGTVWMTARDHATGTERIAEVAATLPPESWVYNVQGDEPRLPPEMLQELARFVEQRTGVRMATLAHRAGDAEGFRSRHVVKVVADRHARALYFSRAPIPAGGGRATPDYLRHVGVYVFRHDVLMQFVHLEPGDLERREGLEQLRALEHGIPVHVCQTVHRSHGVDTPEDLERLQPSRRADAPGRDAERVSDVASGPGGRA